MSSHSVLMQPFNIWKDEKIYNIVSMAILLFCTAACSDSVSWTQSGIKRFRRGDFWECRCRTIRQWTDWVDLWAHSTWTHRGTTEKVPFMRIRANIPDVIQKGSYTGWQNLERQLFFTSSTNSNIHVTWYYYYKLIRNANQILDNRKMGLPTWRSNVNGTI